MGNFDRRGNDGNKRGFRGGDRGGKPSFQKKSWGNDRGADMPMHKATCSECNRPCEVPFRPTGEKPVFCRDCFASKREGVDRASRPDFNNRGPKRDFNDKSNISFTPSPVQDEVKRQLNDINRKLENLLASVDRLTDMARKESQVAKAAPVAVAPKVEVVKTPVKVALKVATKTAVSAKAPQKKVVEKKVAPKKKK